MKKKEWSSFVEKVENLESSNPNRSEAETKSKIIEPMLRKLGWSFIEDEVKVEYPIKFATSTSHVDYALFVDERPEVFVETKPLNSKVTSDDAQQVLDYGKHEEVRWCVLTNGKEIKIYNTEWGKSPQRALVNEISLPEFTEGRPLIEKISKESIESGKTMEYAKTIKQAKDSIMDIEENREDIKEEIVDILKEHAGELLYEKLEKLSSEFISNIIKDLESFTEEKESVTPTEEVERVEEEIPTIERKDLLNKYPEGEVVVTTSKPRGVEDELPSGEAFLEEYKAWGFVNVKREPDYFALYVSKPESKVKYFGKVKDIIEPTDSRSPVSDKVLGEESWSYEEGKKLILLEEDSIVKIVPPIEYGTKMLLGLRYTTLENLVEAETTDDL